MDVLIFVFAVGIVIIGGLYAWTFTKPGKKWLEESEIWMQGSPH